MLRIFEFVIASVEYGVRKPDPLLFRTALGRLDVAAEDTWFVGDSVVNDIAGAQAVGMRTAWFDEAGTAPAPAEADCRFSSWTELAALLA